ncbi:DNA methyltransferase [Flavobacterium sp. CS20]|uniref:DNA methyltransferase n=1 Tax=Flavobacterium sp. CS20 TaxID=2775246 RepID=UPI001B3A74D8|nr:DNA methyltransferase [Flavobacterium sp. CS20]QTY26070.1 hypothetical protein IGB25_08725 [Flavobacterium sp. CS20]
MFTEIVENFQLKKSFDLFEDETKTICSTIYIDGIPIKKYTNEFWTAKQRQANSIHEVSYRACFKPQLPKFFIENLTYKGDFVYDPFLGRGTTAIEAALLGRNIIGNDVNPLSQIFTESRLQIPNLQELEMYLNKIDFEKDIDTNYDLDMFFHEKTLKELCNLRAFILEKESQQTLNKYDKWIRMVAANRLTGHSKGFFSVYTMPPNQAVSRERQIKINDKKQQTPDYRNAKQIILKKSKSLLRDLNQHQIQNLNLASKKAVFLNKDASQTYEIPENKVSLTVTSPPFLDVIQYAKDNWMRAWFNGIDYNEVERKITMSKKIEDWCDKMQNVFHELYRITKPGGHVAFEVGEIRNGKIRLDEYVVPLGIKANFRPVCILINEQVFTKTANIWGVDNNSKGTNSNRVVIFKK